MTNPQIELDCPPEALKRMTDRIRTYWEGIGADNAFWSVITHDKYLKENIEGSIDEFYASGAEVAGSALSHLAAPATCRGLELGCGTGRVSLHLAHRLRELVACDISLPHLELARKNLTDHSVGNVRFENVLEPDALNELGTFDFIFSVITLQHNPPPVIGQYVRTFCSLLNEDGVAFFQLPTSIRGYTFSVEEYLADEDMVMEMHMFPGETVEAIAADYGCSVAAHFEEDMVGSPTVCSEVFVLSKTSTR